MNWFVNIILVMLLVILSGCSLFRADKQAINIHCNQDGVTLKVDGDTKVCPISVEVRRDKKIFVEAYKNGHDKYSKTIDYHLSTSGKWDVGGTFLFFFPVFGLVSPGAWDLDETEINVVLNKLN